MYPLQIVKLKLNECEYSEALPRNPSFIFNELQQLRNVLLKSTFDVSIAGYAKDQKNNYSIQSYISKIRNDYNTIPDYLSGNDYLANQSDIRIEGSECNEVCCT